MTIFSTPPPLQSAVDRYGRALGTAQMLEALHPRTRGNPGNAAALAPAMVLTGIAAFESFAEELLAITAAHRGYGFGQIAKLATMNTPTVKILDDKLTSLPGWTAADRAWTNTFTVRVWKPPAPGQSTWISAHDLTWADAMNAAESWMQVRHCLAHGLVRGTRAEIWPGPLKAPIRPVLCYNNAITASTHCPSTERSHAYRSIARRGGHSPTPPRRRFRSPHPTGRALPSSTVDNHWTMS